MPLNIKSVQLSGHTQQPDTHRSSLTHFVCPSYTHSNINPVCAARGPINQPMKGAKWLNCIKINCKRRLKAHMHSADKHHQSRTSALPILVYQDDPRFRLQLKDSLPLGCKQVNQVYVMSSVCAVWFFSCIIVGSCISEGLLMWEKE